MHETTETETTNPPERQPFPLCEKRRRGVYEREPGSGVWPVRVADQGRVLRKKGGPHGLALKVYDKWKVQIAEGRFFPKQVAANDEAHVDPLPRRRCGRSLREAL